MPDQLHLSQYPSKTVAGTGIRLLTLPSEAAERLAQKLDIAKRIKILRRSALQGEASEEVFAQTHQSAGVDEHSDLVFIVLSYLFTREPSSDKGGWLLAIVPPVDQQAFETYLEAAQRHKFAELQKERALPFHLWTLRGPDYQASHEEVLQVLTDYLITQYRPLWDALTPFKTLWHLARIAGLIGWSKFEATQRLAKATRATFTLKQFIEFSFQEKLQGTKNPEVGIWTEIIASAEIKVKDFLKRLSTYLRRSGYEVPVGHRFLCIAYDRHRFPLEFWRSQAISDYLPDCPRAKISAVSAEGIRQWLHRAGGLVLSEPPIIKGYNPRTKTVEFDLNAARHHGLPSHLDDSR